LREKIKHFLEFLKLYPGRIGITSHANADPDALASSLAMCSIIRNFTSDSPSLIFPEGISKVSRRLLNYLNMDVEFCEDLKENINALIIVDASTLNQLGALKSHIERFRGRVFLIDHHIPNQELIEFCYDSIIESEVATSVIVYKISKEIGVNLSKNELFLILSGILFDTRRFTFASSTSLRVASEIIERGISYTDVVNSLQQKMDLSEKIARLKAAGRMKLYRLDNWLIVTTEVSSFESSAARALISLGADVVFVASRKDNLVRITARCTNLFYEKTKVSVGQDILSKIGEMLGGSGGGHHLAGGATVQSDTLTALKECLELLSKATNLNLKQIKVN